MAIAAANVTFDLRDYLGARYDPRNTKVYAITNIPGGTVFDTSNDDVWVGAGKAIVGSDGMVTLTVPTPGTSNPLSWQTTIVLQYADKATKLRAERRFGPFTITGNALLRELVDEQEVPPTYLTTVTTALQVYVDAAENSATTGAIAATSAAAAATSAAASAELAEYIAGISTPDGVIAAALNSLSSDARAAVIAIIAAQTYDSGWISVGYPGTTETWTRPGGTVAIIPVFQNSWYHQDAGFPVQFRRIGNQVFWRGWMKKTTGGMSDPIATSITANDIAITGLSFLVPTTRNHEFKVPAGAFGALETAVLVGLSSGSYNLRYGSGSGEIVALDAVNYFADN